MNTIETFEKWAAEYRASIATTTPDFDCDTGALVTIYTELYPGRTVPLLTELVDVSRVWTRAQEKAAGL